MFPDPNETVLGWTPMEESNFFEDLKTGLVLCKVVERLDDCSCPLCILRKFFALGIFLHYPSTSKASSLGCNLGGTSQTVSANLGGLSPELT